MIDKLEAGVKYKLVNKRGYKSANTANSYYVNNYLTECGCFILDYVDSDGDGVICGDTVIGIDVGEGEFFTKYDEKIYNEYRVIRKASKHQVCDWRKGEKLYEDKYGTLVRNEKRTKFYTDIIEWREVEVLEKPEPNLMEIFMDNLKGMSKAELSDLMIKIVDLTQINKDK